MKNTLFILLLLPLAAFGQCPDRITTNKELVQCLLTTHIEKIESKGLIDQGELIFIETVSAWEEYIPGEVSGHKTKIVNAGNMQSTLKANNNYILNNFVSSISIEEGRFYISVETFPAERKTKKAFDFSKTARTTFELASDQQGIRIVTKE